MYGIKLEKQENSRFTFCTLTKKTHQEISKCHPVTQTTIYGKILQYLAKLHNDNNICFSANVILLENDPIHNESLLLIRSLTPKQFKKYLFVKKMITTEVKKYDNITEFIKLYDEEIRSVFDN